MTIDLYATGTRFTKTAVIAALVLAALLLATPVAAHAARGTATTPLAQGTGMKARPSVRVRAVQQLLRQRGYNLGATGVDGRFGPRTAAAVRRFQRRNRLTVDGIVGRSTRASLTRPRAVRHAQRHARRHHTQTNDAKATRHAATPATAAPPSTTTTNQPAAPAAVLPPAPTPAATPTSHATHHTGTTLAVPLAIGVVAAFLILASLPLFSESGPGARQGARRVRARRARRAPETTARAAHPANEHAAPPAAPANGDRHGNGTAPLSPGDAVFGYVSVTEDQRAASVRAIRDTCGRAGWSLVAVVCDRANGNPRRHPALSPVLERIAAGEIGGLVVGHDGHADPSAMDGAALDLRSLAGPDFALHDLGVATDGCDVALITLDGRHSIGEREAG